MGDHYLGSPGFLTPNRSRSNSTDFPRVRLRGSQFDHNNALTTTQVLEELIQLAKDIRSARARGEESGLSNEEITFYDALAENESARQVIGEPALKVIAHELVASIKKNVTVDWMHRGSRSDAGLGEAPSSQVRLSARFAGRGGAEGVAAG